MKRRGECNLKKIQLFLLIVTVPFFLLLPLILDFSDFYMHIVIICFYYALLAESWNLVVGYAGQLSFAQAALSGVGAYASTLFALGTGLSPWIAMIFAMVFTTGISYGLGLISLRLRGEYFVLLTLFFGEVCRMIIEVDWQWTRGSLGLASPALFNSTSDTPYYYAMLAIFLCSIYAMYRIVNSRFGLFLKAIREDEDVASTMGLDVARYKTLAFSLSGLFAGLAGAFYAHYTQMLDPNMLQLSQMSVIMVMAYIGGVGRFTEPLIGAFLIQILSQYIRMTWGAYDLIVTGILLIIIMRFARRGGIVDLARKLITRLLVERNAQVSSERDMKAV